MIMIHTIVKRWWWPELACLVPSRWRWPRQLWGFQAMLRARRVLANHNQEGPIGFPGSQVKQYLNKNVISDLDAKEEGQPISPVDLGWQSKLQTISKFYQSKIRRRKVFLSPHPPWKDAIGEASWLWREEICQKRATHGSASATQDVHCSSSSPSTTKHIDLKHKHSV